MERECKDKRLTRAKRVVRPLELLAGSVVLALGGNALEVVGVVLEAARGRRISAKGEWEACEGEGGSLRRGRTDQCLVWFWFGKRAGRKGEQKGQEGEGGIATNRRSQRSGGRTC